MNTERRLKGLVKLLLAILGVVLLVGGYNVLCN